MREGGRLFRFLVVGAFGFVVDTGSLSVFAFALGMNRVVAKGAAFSLAVVSNFVWNRFWVYPDSRAKSVALQIAQFLIVSLVGLLINIGVFSAVDGFASKISGPVLGLYLAQVVAVGTALVWNFAANRVITYSDIKLGR